MPLSLPFQIGDTFLTEYFILLELTDSISLDKSASNVGRKHYRMGHTLLTGSAYFPANSWGWKSNSPKQHFSVGKEMGIIAGRPDPKRWPAWLPYFPLLKIPNTAMSFIQVAFAVWRTSVLHGCIGISLVQGIKNRLSSVWIYLYELHLFMCTQYHQYSADTVGKYWYLLFVSASGSTMKKAPRDFVKRSFPGIISLLWQC